jgi:hypothetical protein
MPERPVWLTVGGLEACVEAGSMPVKACVDNSWLDAKGLCGIAVAVLACVAIGSQMSTREIHAVEAGWMPV